MKKLAYLILALCLSTLALADTTATKVTPLNLPAGQSAGEITGSIKDGQKIPLDWAASSSVALFPGTRFEMFNGNHVFYRIAMPAGSKIEITLTPEKGKLINLYALRQGPEETAAPPNITSTISSEAKYPRYANLGGGRKASDPDNGIRKIEFISIDRPYSILIGVAGAQGLTEGDYKLHINITGR